VNVDLPSCIAGSKRAWDDFVRVAAPVIYAAVRRALRARGRPQQETDDRVQEVYMRLLRDDCRLLRTFDPRRAALSTWLTLIARTVVHEHVRRKRLPTVEVDGLANMARTPSAADAAAPTSGRDNPPIPMSLLSDQQRQVIEMLFHHGLTVEQAAARLRVQPQTIRSAKHKALTRLREHLHTAMEDPEHADLKGYSDTQPATARKSTPP
jgi:RNA polymerase sigma-70 factor (ECF subfamily)